MTIHVDRCTVARLTRHASQEHPFECCGILVGKRVHANSVIPENFGLSSEPRAECNPPTGGARANSPDLKSPESPRSQHFPAAIAPRKDRLMNRDGVSGSAVVVGIIPAKNIADGDHRKSYQIDWATLIRAVRAEREGELADLLLWEPPVHSRREPRGSHSDGTGGPRIVGFYHSHPDGSIEPSDADRQAAWVGYSYVIVSTQPDRSPALSSWYIACDGEAFVKEELAFEGSASQDEISPPARSPHRWESMKPR